ncbi:50S ribosomal protein L18e [Candidatus Woesearchaeota archaeon]|nr:50S ribosomal protein L18e [Candidatus Woesearchaeota archaeon]
MAKNKNEQMTALITALKTLAIQKESKLWKRIATDLEKATRARREVNVYKIDTFAKEGEIVIVPGKVLGSGALSKKITVAALSFSESAKDKILANKGEVLTITELMQKNPQGNKVRVMG